MTKNLRITVLGAGYVGLPTALLFSNSGIQTTVVDVDSNKLALLKAGEFKTEEVELQALYQAAHKSEMINFENRVELADVYIICVPTPIDTDLKPDMSHVWSVMHQLKGVLKNGDLVILESTSPPGTIDQLVQILSDSDNTSEVEFAYCPERVLPGDTLREIRENDRIIGGNTPQAADRAAKLYETVCVGHVSKCDARTAEIAKLAENAFRAVNIAFANELARLCMKNEVDVRNVISLANRHPRVKILDPGIGVGGHCIPVDPLFLYPNGVDISNSVIWASNKFNDSVPYFVAESIIQAISKTTETVIIEGLGYKPNSGDLRNSPALQILRILCEARPDLNFEVFDPSISQLPDWLRLPNNASLKAEKPNQVTGLRVRLVKNSQFIWKPDFDFSNGVLYEEN